MTDEPLEADALPPRTRNRARALLRERIAMQRWVLLACVFVAAAALYTGAPVAPVSAGLAIVAGAALLAPARKPLIARRLRRKRAVSAWPETGMKHLADAFPNPCFIVDRRGVTRYANTAARIRFGQVRPGDPISFRLRSPALLEALERVIDGDSAQRIEWSEKSPAEQWLEAVIAPVTSAPAPGAGDVEQVAASGRQFILVTIQDQTGQRRLERMRADFVANASHELRTPLASLTGFTETLLGPARDDPVAREKFLQIMMQQGERMRRLIDDLLSLSRVELKAHVQPETTLDLVPLVRHTCEALKPVADEVGVSVEMTLPETPAVVRGDRDELIEVLENLIENSLKYGASGKRIEVGLSWMDLDRPQAEPRPPGQWVLSIRDHGPGIAPEHLPRLTERFYRVDVAASREMKGTGLGLAIVKHILTRHRARLDIESRLGEGATFLVKIPAAISDVESEIDG
ncbi:ATP-binding protein [Stappia stellulata]|uniref:ATP-binding protein n=1 Tax=Stappia stellulata TaxID=71235 RepID=UPI0006843803|nr:ATP-binding protein [Stappia stellulata]